jgi:glutaredoxin
MSTATTAGVGARARRLRLLALAASLVLPLTATVAQAEVYRWKDADGVTHYSDTRPAAQPAEVVAIAAHRPASGAPPPPLAAAPTAPPPPVAALAPEIVMYSNPDCGWCRRAERWFASRRLAYRTIDITASERNRAEFLRLGGRGTPLIFVDGVRVAGFDEARLDALTGGR